MAKRKTKGNAKNPAAKNPAAKNPARKNKQHASAQASCPACELARHRFANLVHRMHTNDHVNHRMIKRGRA